VKKVFVFPSCNEPGLEIINSLTKSNKFEIWGGSSYNIEFDPSRVILANYVPCPDYYEQNFRIKFEQILVENKIDFVFPALDVLVAEFAQWHLHKTKFITTNSNTAQLLLSKGDTYRHLKSVIPVPEIYKDSRVEFPIFAKPDHGSGSRGNLLVTNEIEFALARERKLLLCEYLPGAEFTVDCINDLSGNMLFHNVRIRGNIGRGISLGTKDRYFPEIEDYVSKIAENIRIEGPWFAQFKLSRDGIPKLMEINARVAGSMGLTRFLGVNIPLISLFLYSGSEVKIPATRQNITLNRCLKNLGELDNFNFVIWDLDDTILRKDGKPDPDAIACLIDLENRNKKQILLTKNQQARELILTHHIPNVFVETRISEDKITETGRILVEFGLEQSECILVNDAYSELLAFQEQYPRIRVITPDVLDVLGREKIK
jgi:hypothetical protein